MATLKIDDKEYNLDDLSDEIKSNFHSIKIVDQKIAQLKTDLAIAEVARNAYSNTLAQQLKELEK